MTTRVGSTTDAQVLVYIATLACVDEDNGEVQSGGLQRWARDVARLIAENGYSVRILQKSSKNFTHKLGREIDVVGIPCRDGFLGNFEFSGKVATMLPPQSAIVFVSQELLLSGKFSRVVAVNHGIWWDGDYTWWKKSINKRVQASTIRRAAKIICVDTNYLNWCHAELSGRDSWRDKLVYIPNYADEECFPELPRTDPPGRALRILFPRRLSGHDLWVDGRGSGLLLRALEILYRSGVEFVATFAGPGRLAAEILNFARAAGFEDSVKIASYTLDEMPRAYGAADVVVVPSTGHEGTSLAAVEALCSGCPTVVTTIGGLPNLVFNGINGFVADLSPTSLANAILQAAQKSRDWPWRRNAAALARNAFGKQRWNNIVWSHLAAGLELANSASLKHSRRT